MNDTKIYIIAILVTIALALGGFLFGRYTTKPEVVIKYITKIDSTFVVMPAETLTVTGKGKIQYQDRDKFIFVDRFIDTCKPFISKLDTIVKKDTLSLAYNYPNNVFSIILKQKPDSVLTRTITINSDPVEIKRPLFIDVLSHSGSFIIGGLIGYGIGRIR